MPTIAVGSFLIECNQFGGALADLETFRRYDYLSGDEMLSIADGAVGGMLSLLDEHDHAVAPLIVASACPSSVVTDAAYDHLKNELLDRLRVALDVDGVLLALHGAAASESIGDLEGDLLEAVRNVVGRDIPIVATLDLHAHVSQQMIDHCDALFAWETYPHRDAFTTGQRGARAIVDILAGALKPTMVSANVPVLVSATLGHTEGPGPFADVMRKAKQLEREDDRIYSVSAFLVYPYLNVPDMGGGAVVITHDDEPLAEDVATDLASDYGDRRLDLEPDLFTPADAIAQASSLGQGPVILAETADCCGGGAAGDGAHVLRALLDRAPDLRAYVPIVDPEATRACHESRVGESITLSLGHRLDPKWGDPVEVTGRIERLTDGVFTYRGGIWDGRVAEMGPSVLLGVDGILIGVSSHPTYEWAGEQLEHFGVSYRDLRFVVAKNPMNYHMAFADNIASFVLDTPGPTPPTCRHLDYTKMARPYHPADEDIDRIVVFKRGKRVIRNRGAA